MDALEKQYQATEKEISDLKHELGEVMGANVHGKQGNQLLDDEKWGGYAPEEEHRTPNMGGISPAGNAVKPGLNMSSGKPQFSVSDTPAHVTGLNNGADSFFGYRPEDYKEPSDALFGKRPEDYEDAKGVTNSGGGYADFFREQREKDEKIKLVGQIGDISNVVGNVPYKGLLEDIAQISDLSQVDDAQIIDVKSGDGRNDVLEIYLNEVLAFEDKADTLMGYYGAAKSIVDMVAGLLNMGSKAVDVLTTVKEVMEESGQFSPEDYQKLSAQIITEGRYFKIDMTDTVLRPFGGSDTYYYTVMVELHDSNNLKQPYHTYVYTRNMNTPPALGSYMNPK